VARQAIVTEQKGLLLGCLRLGWGHNEDLEDRSDPVDQRDERKQQNKKAKSHLIPTARGTIKVFENSKAQNPRDQIGRERAGPYAPTTSMAKPDIRRLMMPAKCSSTEVISFSAYCASFGEMLCPTV
jgi:hypothetical protein